MMLNVKFDIMKAIRTDEEILSGVTESYGDLGTQSSVIVGAFRKGVNWSDNHPRIGLVDINKAREWVKNAFISPYGQISPFGEELANSIADEFVKAMEE
jgi:hypothetical protein